MKFNVSKKDRYKSGIYKIRNTINKRIYYGSAEKFLTRYNSHKHSLIGKSEKKANKILLNFVKKYGFDKLVFEIVEFCTVDKLHEREQVYLDEVFLRPAKERFNIARKAVNNAYLNLEMPEEHGRRISKALKGKKKPDSYSVNFSMSRGRPIGRFSSDGILIEEFATNLFVKNAGYDPECVRRVCVGERNSYLGFFWAFLTDGDENRFNLEHIRMSFNKDGIRPEKEVCLFSTDGKFVREFANNGEAAKFLNLNSCSLRIACSEQRPVKNVIVLFKDFFGTNDLSEIELKKILSPKLYSGYSPEGELISTPKSLETLARKVGLSRSKIRKSLNKQVEYAGLFWIQE